MKQRLKMTVFYLAVAALLVIQHVNCGRFDATGSAPSDLGGSDGSGGGTTGSDELSAELASAFKDIPNIIVCQSSSPSPFVEKVENGVADATYFQRCAATCIGDWRACARASTARGRDQLEVDFVVDENGNGSGFGGTIRFTKSGDFSKTVMFHKGGSGTDWVDDFLPDKVEGAGGVAVEPKWFAQGTGWFNRPFSGSSLERSLVGITKRPAAVMKWIYLNLTNRKVYSTAACSGGSIATYYPRHWHRLDPLFSYQLLGGGPVMANIEGGCRGGGNHLGRCTSNADKECDADADCLSGEGTCSPYQWGRGTVMTAVRATIDQLHSEDTLGGNFCVKKMPQPIFDISNFDNSKNNVDYQNEHPIDFIFNVSASANADNDLNVISQGGLVYNRLLGKKKWYVENSGIHCDALNGQPGWDLLSVGAGFSR